MKTIMLSYWVPFAGSLARDTENPTPWLPEPAYNQRMILFYEQHKLV
jgi:hypothetical protein